MVAKFEQGKRYRMKNARTEKGARIFKIDWAGDLRTVDGRAFQNVARRFETDGPLWDQAGVQRTAVLDIHMYDEVPDNEYLYFNVYRSHASGRPMGGLPHESLERAVQQRQGSDNLFLGCVEVDVSTETVRWIKP